VAGRGELATERERERERERENWKTEKQRKSCKRNTKKMVEEIL
jgi:hypothetical protein